MTTSLRDGKFDVVVAAGPNVEVWPSVGARVLTLVCAEMGLSVGVFGGDDLIVRGVIPLPGTGGIVVIEDAQKRIHRIQARAIVKLSSGIPFPDPFPGWRSEGLIPIPTAERLLRESQVLWEPSTVILGTGNRALRFGSRLLESGAPEVFCVETDAQWGAKRFAGWEVERRRFELAGGRLIEAVPVRLSRKAAQLWELRVQDQQGVRVLEVCRVVSGGPFRSACEIREYPASSLLFEIEQTAPALPEEDMNGWMNEQERGRLLGAKIVRALSHDLGEHREELDRVYKRARGRLKRYSAHLEDPFTPLYQGKWIASADSRRIRAFSGVPKKEQKLRPVASVECFEAISCNVCQTVCPAEAITIGAQRPTETPILREDLCTACGLCVERCPSSAIVMIEEREDRPTAKVTLPWRGQRQWTVGEFAVVLNRRGESLGNARVTALPEAGDPVPGKRVQLVEVEVPSHLAWEARGIRRARAAATEDDGYLASIDRAANLSSKVEVTVNGDKRLVRDQIPVTVALYETGQNRPEDALFCRDGSCGLCHVTVDGVKKLACQTKIHRGMAIRIDRDQAATEACALCPCLGVKPEQISERITQGRLRSPEAVLSVTHVGEGKCHGQICAGPLRRLLGEHGIGTQSWIDWRFPWSEWVIT